MCAWSRKAALGSFTRARAMLASPGFAVRLASRRGWEVRLVGPFRARESLGLKGRPAQPPTWKRWARGVIRLSAVVAEPLIAISSQEVGLRVKEGRVRVTLAPRRSGGGPWVVCGEGWGGGWGWGGSGAEVWAA